MSGFSFPRSKRGTSEHRPTKCGVGQNPCGFDVFDSENSDGNPPERWATHHIQLPITL